MPENPNDWYQAEIKPRDLTPNPRCRSCKTGPMFHPAHRWGTCQVRLEGGAVCGCTVDVESPRNP